MNISIQFDINVQNLIPKGTPSFIITDRISLSLQKISRSLETRVGYVVYNSLHLEKENLIVWP